MDTPTTYPEHSAPGQATVVYLPTAQAAVVHGDRSTRPVVSPVQHTDGLVEGKIVPWGDDNDMPNRMVRLGLDNTLIGETLSKKVNLLFGKGVAPFILEGYDKNNEEMLRPLKREEAPEVFEFMLRSNINRYLLEAANDLYWFLNPFPEMVLSKDRKKIVQLVAQEATDCRYEVMDKTQGRSLHCYINANWPLVDWNYIHKVPTIDPYDPYRFEALRAGRKWKYIYPLSYPSPGKKYYQLASWYSAHTSGWLAVAQAIPAWKKSLMQKQVTVKYMVMVPDYWWEWKYPDWNTLKGPEGEKTRKKRMQEEYKKFEDFLMGPDNAGKMIMTTFKYDKHLQKEFPGWKLEPVPTAIKDGMYIEDSHEASAHLLYALGVDPTLVGFKVGKNQTSSGSGSDKRVAFNMYIESIEPHRKILLEPLYFISRYNQWPDDLRWVIRYPMIQVLSSGEEVSTSSPDASV